MDDGYKLAGIIYGTTTTTRFTMASTSTAIAKGTYVSVEIGGINVLGIIEEVEAHSSLDFTEARDMVEGIYKGKGKKVDIAAKVNIIGYRDKDGCIKQPKIPPRPGSEVYFAPPDMLKTTLGLCMSREAGATIGKLEGTMGVDVILDINRMIQGHVSILARTGGGKSYTAGIIIEELLKKDVATLILDPHGEYTSMIHPNIDEEECMKMIEFDITPRGYSHCIRIYTVDDSNEGEPLRFSKLNMEVDDLIDCIAMHPSSVGISMLYKAIERLKFETKVYSIRDIIDVLDLERSHNKYGVINQLERINAMRIFTEDVPTPLTQIVSKGWASVINLRGISPLEKDIVVTMLLKKLFRARKSGEVPPFMIIAEEAHQYCPQSRRIMPSEIMRTIASEGRKFGIGLCIVSQRPAKVDKNVLSQCNTSIIMKVTNPNDLNTIVSSVEGLTRNAVEEIQRLPTGMALVMGAGITVPIKVKMRIRESMHGGKGVDVVAFQD